MTSETEAQAIRRILDELQAYREREVLTVELLTRLIEDREMRRRLVMMPAFVRVITALQHYWKFEP